MQNSVERVLSLIKEKDIKMVDFKMVDINGQFRHVTHGTLSPSQYFFTVFREIPNRFAAVRWLVTPSNRSRRISL